MEYALKFVMMEKYLKKIMVSRNLHQVHLLEVGLAQIPGDHETLSIVRHVVLHLDFLSLNYYRIYILESTH